MSIQLFIECRHPVGGQIGTFGSGHISHTRHRAANKILRDLLWGKHQPVIGKLLRQQDKRRIFAIHDHAVTIENHALGYHAAARIMVTKVSPYLR